MKSLDSTKFIHNLSYDSVIFGFNGKQLKILILEYQNTNLYALPGGFVKIDQSLEDTVKQGVKERTGLDQVYLEQFHVFGSLERSDPRTMAHILKESGQNPEENQWMLGRFISIAYYALINYEKVKPTPDYLSDSINWYPIDELPPLMMDHGLIVDKALEVLRDNLEQKLIGMNLLPEKFTMKQLQKVYEVVLDKKLRRTTFQRKILSLNILERHEKLFTGKANKAPYLYSFKQQTTVQKRN